MDRRGLRAPSGRARLPSPPKGRRRLRRACRCAVWPSSTAPQRSFGDFDDLANLRLEIVRIAAQPEIEVAFVERERARERADFEAKHFAERFQIGAGEQRVDGLVLRRL